MFKKSIQLVLAFLKLLIARNIFIGILVVINPKNLTRYRMDGLGDCPGTHRQNGLGLGHDINIIAAVLPLFGKTGVFQVAGGVSLTVKVIGQGRLLREYSRTRST